MFKFLLFFLLLSTSCFAQQNGNGMIPSSGETRKTFFEFDESSTTYYEVFLRQNSLIRATITHFMIDIYVVDEFIFKEGKIYHYSSRKIKDGEQLKIVEIDFRENLIDIKIDHVYNFERSYRINTLLIVEYKLDRILKIFK